MEVIALNSVCIGHRVTPVWSGMSTTTPEFVGFSDDTFLFLRELAEHNDRVWFEKNRQAYKDHLIAPAKLLVQSIGARLDEFSPDFQADPRVNGSILPINRDIRLSKDKTPYRTHLELWFWEGGPERTWDCSGFFFRMTPQSLILGTGIHAFSKTALASYREAIVNPPEGSALVNAIRRVEQAGPYEMGGDSFKRVPTGYDPDGEQAELLKKKGLYVQIEGPIPHNIFTRKFVDYCVAHFRNIHPVHQWLVATTSPSQ